MNLPSKVFLVDSNKLSLLTLSLWMEQLSDYEVVGTALPQSKLEAKILNSCPNLVLLSTSHCGLETLSTVRRIKQTDSTLPIILIYEDEAENLEAIRPEVEATVSCQVPLKDLLKIMKQQESKLRLASRSSLMTKAG
jgi:DNA-binding NarL/FixJ family response regulator